MRDNSLRIFLFILMKETRNMKFPYLILTSLLLFCGHAYSQKVNIVKKSDTFQRKKKSREISYLSNAADTSGLEYVATISSRAVALESKALARLWTYAVRRGMKSGANTFRFHSYTDTDSTRPELILDFFFADKAALQRNTDREEKNVVYIFGNKGKAMSLKVNGEQLTIPADSSLRYELLVGSELKISKGSFAGDSYTTQWAFGKTAEYLSISGFGPNGMYVPALGAVGLVLSLSSGHITPMNPNFGRMIMDMQKK